MLETCGQSCNWAVTAVVFFVVAPFASFYLWLACVVCKSVAIGAVVVGCKHARAFMPRWFFDLHHLFISSTQIGKCFDRKPCEKSVPDCRCKTCQETSARSPSLSAATPSCAASRPHRADHAPPLFAEHECFRSPQLAVLAPVGARRQLRRDRCPASGACTPSRTGSASCDSERAAARHAQRGPSPPLQIVVVLDSCQWQWHFKTVLHLALSTTDVNSCTRARSSCAATSSCGALGRATERTYTFVHNAAVAAAGRSRRSRRGGVHAPAWLQQLRLVRRSP